ncbi:hypothetical protein BJX70DRAFT_404477 [Aspergillus crustosus]
MAEVLRQESRSDTFGSNPAFASPTKRRPPKLKRKVSPENNPDRHDRPMQYQSGQGTKEQGFFNNIRSSVEEVSPNKSESEGLPSGDTQLTYPDPAPVSTFQRGREEKGKQAIVIERGEQQLIQLDDVGDTVNETQQLVKEVGTKGVETVGQTARGAVETVGNAVSLRGNKSETEQLRLRLDLNLDIEVQLKAKIHGDLTLQLFCTTIAG